MLRLGEFEIVAMFKAVKAEIAAVDDEIGARGVDVFADPTEVLGQSRVAAAEVGIGNLGQAKYGHASLYLPP